MIEETMNNYYVYELIDPRDNQVFYVGKGKEKRMYYHAHNVKQKMKNEKFHSHKDNKIKTILLAGFDVIYNKVIENLTEEEAFQKEIELIKLYGRIDLNTGILCNHSGGGEGVTNISDETRQKISNAHKGKKISEEQKKKISLIHKGKKLSFAHIQILKAANTGVKKSKETREKVSGSNNPFYGKKHSDESRKKISESTKGRIPWNKGKTNIYSQETIKKMKENAKNRGPISEKTRIKISNANKGKKRTEEQKENYKRASQNRTKDTLMKISNKLKGRPKSESHKQKLRDAIQKNRIMCDICGQTTTKSAYIQHHLNKCKHKIEGK